MPTRSERARKRAVKVRNQRIAIVAVILLLIIAGGFYIFQSNKSPSTETADLPIIFTESGLQYQDLVIGSGTTANPGDIVSVHYTGWLEDGTKFDSSLDRDQAFEFQLGAGQVIKGWDEGVAGMKTGGKRQLIIPPDLGYGVSGSGNVIPPNAVLIFDVELLAVK